jgi:hypothetical protein
MVRALVVLRPRELGEEQFSDGATGFTPSGDELFESLVFLRLVEVSDCLLERSNRLVQLGDLGIGIGNAGFGRV